MSVQALVRASRPWSELQQQLSGGTLFFSNYIISPVCLHLHTIITLEISHESCTMWLWFLHAFHTAVARLDFASEGILFSSVSSKSAGTPLWYGRWVFYFIIDK